MNPERQVETHALFFPLSLANAQGRRVCAQLKEREDRNGRKMGKIQKNTPPLFASSRLLRVSNIRAVRVPLPRASPAECSPPSDEVREYLSLRMVPARLRVFRSRFAPRHVVGLPVAPLLLARRGPRPPRRRRSALSPPHLRPVPPSTAAPRRWPAGSACASAAPAAVRAAAPAPDPEHAAWLASLKSRKVVVPKFEWSLEWALPTPVPQHQFEQVRRRRRAGRSLRPAEVPALHPPRRPARTPQSPVVIEVTDRNPHPEALVLNGPDVAGGYPDPLDPCAYAGNPPRNPPRTPPRRRPCERARAPRTSLAASPPPAAAASPPRSQDPVDGGAQGSRLRQARLHEGVVHARGREG